ncbi:hypothetical protein GPECTOR_69g414 [Gonium pectorale]|uniref:Uncharacterized protein n=1 Tax=Gonium pectorale TaxID=33097 RepID=A0A150G3E9_GONPE|nr:hypothetical protein GPECTOR_69g414 [Gonium pectorale]|eukprot:KXZ44321.1 hypothetical protein GPECTOR_69g414 [Gonium pectorale]
MAEPGSQTGDYLEAAVDPSTDAVTVDILSGLGNWEAQVTAALQGRPLHEPFALPEDVQSSQPYTCGGRQGWQPRYTAHYGYGSGYGGPEDVGRDLTASEAIAMEPDGAQQQALQRLKQRREQRAAALTEKQLRYRAGLENFTNPTRQLRPPNLPPPRHQPPPDVAYTEGIPPPPAAAAAHMDWGRSSDARGTYLTQGPFDAGAGTGAGSWTGAHVAHSGSVSGRRAGGEADTHETLFPRQVQHMTGPGVEQQPHPRSPLQRRMHGQARPRKKWSPPKMSPQRNRDGAGSQSALDAASEEALAARQQREQQRAQLLDRWMAEMRSLSAATARAEATKQVAVASAQQALVARRERQTAELAGIFNLLGEVDELARTMEDQAQETKHMMQTLEEEAELRQASRLNALLFEAQKLGSQVDEALKSGGSPGAPE